MKTYESQVFELLNNLNTAARLYHTGKINDTEFEEMKTEITIQNRLFDDTATTVNKEERS